MAEKKVLTVIEKGVLVHIGAPQTFNSDLIVGYAKSKLIRYEKEV